MHILNTPEALRSNECAQQSQITSQRWKKKKMWNDGIQKLNDREAKTALGLSALIVG